ncbi:MAG: fructose-6-phosphate aldolase [Myxococcales bacterium]|nr:fructose-6-phosphate aldolase [Myxococcales bacterium]
MKIFIDSANVNEIKDAVALGLCDGVTTNPSLIAKTGKPNAQVIAEICRVTKAPVNAETVGISYDEIVKEGEELARLAPNVVIKIPLCKDGLRAVRYFADRQVPTTVTLVFNANQALLAAKAGAAYIAPFVGRLDDVSVEGLEMIEEIVDIYEWYEFATEIVVASVRHPLHVKQAALAGAHAVTIPFNLVEKMIAHPLTDIGIEKFLADAGRK